MKSLIKSVSALKFIVVSLLCFLLLLNLHAINQVAFVALFFSSGAEVGCFFLVLFLFNSAQPALL